MLHALRRQSGHNDAETTTTNGFLDRKKESKPPRRRSSGLRFFASAPTPVTEVEPKTQKKWEADYLKDLREHKPSRPGGSRPLPGRDERTTALGQHRSESAMSFRPLPANLGNESSTVQNARSASALSHHRMPSALPRRVQDPNNEVKSGGVDAEPTTVPQDSATPNKRDFSPLPRTSGMYQEGGLRWMERQEAKSLRAALEDMDSLEDAKLQAAAQKEATELVLEHHQNGGGRLYDSVRSRNYREHLEKGAHARSISQAFDENAVQSKDPNHQNPARADKTGQGDGDLGPTPISPAPRGPEEPEHGSHKGHHLWDSPERKAYLNMTFPLALRKSSGRRRSSGQRARNVSGGLFRNPNDKIYEEPQEKSQQIKWADGNPTSTESVPLASKTRNFMGRRKSSGGNQLRASISAEVTKLLPYRSEIHKNPPSKSRDPSYTRNEGAAAHDRQVEHGNRPVTDHGGTHFPQDREIRGEDIRAATSKRRSDRSSKLPSPSAVSQRPGRPIVSFDKDWSPSQPKEETTQVTSVPSITIGTTPPIHVTDSPTIKIHDFGAEIPKTEYDKHVEDNSPTIVISEEPPKPRALPRISTQPTTERSHRPLPSHSSTAPVQPSATHWSVPRNRMTTQCAACALSIAGRVVSAAGQRFHPHCFTCHHCAEALECVAFYPEPEQQREERVARIQARIDGNCVPDDIAGATAADDGDESLRFYCHLDFHELFSPRCKSCKTPIESEVIVACGNTWHVGHFFCAECGDPFDAKTPFVEKDGYAWCLKCHAGRFSGRCRGCRKAVVTEGIRALDAEWHVECFVCKECHGSFEDGRFFTRDDDPRPVCVSCEEARLKA